MKIKDIVLQKTRFTLEEPFKVAFTTITGMESMIVTITTDEGITGYGEAAPFELVTGDTLDTVRSVGEFLKPELIGQDPRSINAIHEIMDGTIAGNTAIKAGIDIACYDIASKAAGVPLYRYLGGSHCDVESDVTIGIADPMHMAEKAVQWKNKGFGILKVKLGEDIKTDIQRIQAIRKAVGEDEILRVDANQGWTLKDTLNILPALEEVKVSLLEQPLKAWDIDGMKRLTAMSRIRIAADESCHSVYDAARIAKEHAADVVNIKLMKCGGILNALKINAVCESNGIECMVGCMGESSLANAAGMHLAAALTNIHYADLDSAWLLKQDKVIPGFRHQGGCAQLMEIPGTKADEGL